MVKNRNLFIGFLLSVITLGFYILYWFVSTKKEINEQGGQIPTSWLIIIPLVNIYWTYKYCDEFGKIIKKEKSGILYFLLQILFFPAFPIIVQSSLNKIANKSSNTQQINQNQLTPGQQVNSTNESLSENEINAKNYIEQYKTNYSKESISSALLNSGIPQEEINVYLNKYY